MGEGRREVATLPIREVEARSGEIWTPVEDGVEMEVEEDWDDKWLCSISISIVLARDKMKISEEELTEQVWDANIHSKLGGKH